MTRLSAAFAKDHPALVTFVTAGDPTPDATGAILDALARTRSTRGPYLPK